jgi:hypothetical protein
MNAIMERWVQTCRRELLDRTLIWNQQHLLHALREFEQFYNSHRPHQGIANARPLHALPSPIPWPDATTRLHVHRHDHLGGILHEYRHAALPVRMRFSASTGSGSSSSADRVVEVPAPATAPFLPARTSSAPMWCRLTCFAIEEQHVSWPHWCHLSRFGTFIM